MHAYCSADRVVIGALAEGLRTAGKAAGVAVGAAAGAVQHNWISHLVHGYYSADR